MYNFQNVDLFNGVFWSGYFQMSIVSCGFLFKCMSPARGFLCSVFFDLQDQMPVVLPAMMIGLTFVCVYEIKFHWSVDYRGGRLSLERRLKRVAGEGY